MRKILPRKILPRRHGMMRVFYGIHRKLSILPLLVFFVGWVAYLVGFIKRISSPSPLLPKWDNYPAIVAVTVGPVFILTTLLQSCLSGTPSAAVGTVSAAAAVLFLVSIGNSSITTAQLLYQYNSTESNRTDGVLALPYVSATLAGSILCSLSITLLLSLWSYYHYNPPPRDQQSATLQDSTSGSHRKCVQAFPGSARKLAIPCLLLSLLGWGTMMAGHQWRIGTFIEEGSYADDVLIFNFGQWTTCVLTPLLLLIAFIQAAFSGPASSAMGVATALLNGFVLISIGYYMIHDVGAWLKKECEKKCDYALPRNAGALAEIVGAFVTCFFWASVLGLWPFYAYQKHPSNVRGTSSDDSGLLTPPGFVQRGYRRQEEDDVDAIEL